MRKGLIGPLVAVGVLAGLYWAGARAETYSLDAVFHCNRALTQLDQPAADILFVGNSQTGAAIDTKYVADLVDPSGKTRVEKLAIVQGHIVAVRMTLDDYVEHRGAPKLIVLQPMVVRAEEWQKPAGRPIHPRVNLDYQPWDEIAALQRDAKFAPHPLGLPEWVHAGYRSLPAVFVDRIVERISAALSYPRMIKYKRMCEKPDLMFRQADRWPLGNIKGPTEAGALPNVSDATHAEWAAELRKRRPAAFNDPSRLFEIDQHRKLLASLRKSGSKVMLVGYPIYSTAQEDAQNFKDLSKVLGEPVIDIRSLLTPEEQAELEKRFRDPFHVSFPGAELLSRHLAEEAAKAKQ